MSIALGILGALIILLVVADLLWTVFLEGAGPMTGRINATVGKIILSLHRPLSRRPLTLAGLLTVVATLAAWSILLWAGWGLIFCASPGALIDSNTGQPADCGARFYFAGACISTLGTGDYRPIGHFWQIMTALAGGSGFVLFGLAVAYLVPVVGAVTQKRQVAVCISSLGSSPGDIIFRAWNGMDTSALAPHLVSLTQMLALLGESHLTYPVLHVFHSGKRSSAVAPSVAALDEALTILECGLQKGCSLDLPSLGAARAAITEFLSTLAPALIEPAKEAPPMPTLHALKDMGVPVVEDQLFEMALANLANRRKMLLALVRKEGWTWEDVWPRQ
jgi:hypothetical protein